MRSDENDIRELHTAWIAAVNAGEPGRLLPMMADDVVFLNPGEAPLGRDGFVVGFVAAHREYGIFCVWRAMPIRSCRWRNKVRTSKRALRCG